MNAGTLDAASRDPAYQRLLAGEGVNLPDGRPLASVLRRTHPADQVCEQVRGPWLFETCLDRGREFGLQHYLLGSTEATMVELQRQIAVKFPGALVVGTYSPPFHQQTPTQVQHQDHRIRTSGAHIIWVALGTPKQDAEALRILRSTGQTTAAVGAAFDFTAGTKATAPKWLTTHHMEWSYRLFSEPRRLWRRYLIGNTRFVILTLRHWFQNRS
ncbi:WecB/TagA/CpsF family glycosyltransferase [Nocardioides sp.]|uniref:WecB/TagA/CpsF family glycosyltransferase n=1 Tax=Nocardioides sp. TaxID=35761 RepID=UPI00351DAF89